MIDGFKDVSLEGKNKISVIDNAWLYVYQRAYSHEEGMHVTPQRSEDRST